MGTVTQFDGSKGLNPWEQPSIRNEGKLWEKQLGFFKQQLSLIKGFLSEYHVERKNIHNILVKLSMRGLL